MREFKQVHTKKLTKQDIEEAKYNSNKMEEVILNYYPMVYKIVNKTNTTRLPGVDYSDLVSIGLDAIYKAVTRFDINKENSFDTYCYTCIKGYILQEIRKFSKAKTGDLNQRLLSIEKMNEMGFSFANMVVDEKDYEELAINGEPDPDNGWRLIKSSLSDIQVDLVERYYIHKESPTKIGESYGITPQALHARLKAINKQLSKKYTKEQLYFAFGLPMEE
nr:MAG TPA: DNA directed RNA polymerase subunit [Caudoviricetes sp.]